MNPSAVASSANSADASSTKPTISRFSRRSWKAPPPVTLSYDASASPFTSTNYAAAAPTPSSSSFDYAAAPTPSSSFDYAAAPTTTSPAHKKNSDASTKAGSARSVKKRASSPSASASKRVHEDSESSSDTPVSIPLNLLPPHHFSLGGDMIVKVTDFTGTVRVHVRSFKCTDKSISATKHGITMSALTYSNFIGKSHNAKNQKEIKVFNKELFVCCTPDLFGEATYTLQQLATRQDKSFNLLPTSVTLDYKQFDALEESSKQIWKSIQQIMFGKTFQETVLRLRGIAASVTENSVQDLTFILIETVKSAVQENICKVYFCPECYLPFEDQPKNQLGHDCCTITGKEMWNCNFMSAFCMIHPKALAQSYVKACGDLAPLISEEFLQNLNAVDITQTARHMD